MTPPWSTAPPLGCLLLWLCPGDPPPLPRGSAHRGLWGEPLGGRGLERGRGLAGSNLPLSTEPDFNVGFAAPPARGLIHSQSCRTVHPLN